MSIFGELIRRYDEMAPIAGGVYDTINKGNYLFKERGFEQNFKSKSYLEELIFQDHIVTHRNFKYDLYKSRNDEWYTGIINYKSSLGVEGVLRVIWIQFRDYSRYINRLNKNLNYKLTKLYSSERVNTLNLTDEEDFQRTGIATSLYKWIVDNKYPIIGDEEQYFGARRLWSKLSGIGYPYKVNIVNIETGEVIDENMVIKSPKDYQDFDERFYSVDTSKGNIRPILVKGDVK